MSFIEMPELDSSKKEKTSITPLPLLEVGAEASKSIEQFENFSLNNFLAVLWEGVRHVQILADEANIEIPIIPKLSREEEVTYLYKCFPFSLTVSFPNIRIRETEDLSYRQSLLPTMNSTRKLWSR